MSTTGIIKRGRPVLQLHLGDSVRFGWAAAGPVVALDDAGTKVWVTRRVGRRTVRTEHSRSANVLVLEPARDVDGDAHRGG